MDKILDFDKEVNIVNAIKDYVAHVQTAYNKAPGFCNEEVKVHAGRKFHKIVVVRYDKDPARTVIQSHVHSFVDRATGDLYKAASWHQPAKGVRYNLIKDMPRLAKEIDFAGGYLYKRGR